MKDWVDVIVTHKGVELGRYSVPLAPGDSRQEVALRAASHAPPGSIVRLVEGRSQWRYRVERFAGLPSITRIKKRSRARDNPLSSNEKTALVVGGLAVVGVAGYYLLSKPAAAASTTPAGTGTMTPGTGAPLRLTTGLGW